MRFKDDFIPSHTGTFTYLFIADIVAQDVQANLDAGFPQKWRNTTPDYGMDPDVIGPDDQYQGEFANQIDAALKAVPSISVVMDMDDLFDERGASTQIPRAQAPIGNAPHRSR